MPRTKTLTPEEKEHNDKKSMRISDWKINGIIDEDLHAVYDYYIKETHCMVCFKVYKNTFDKCLDHDHKTGEIRYICCRKCNTNILIEKNPVHTKPKSNNTSGHLNIYNDKDRDKWEFRKMINKELIYERFDTIAEAVQWKIDNNYP
jgi:hypothetical protein